MTKWLQNFRFFYLSIFISHQIDYLRLLAFPNLALTINRLFRHIHMDDRFLYNHIKQAIKERKQLSKDADEGNFAQNYCRRQLMKKKLNFNTNVAGNPGGKMKSLMKNFTHVETYVDLNELLFSINAIRTKEIAERKTSKLQERQRISRLSRLKDLTNFTDGPLSHFSKFKPPQQVIDPIQALKDRFRGEINEMIKRKYQQQNNEMNEIVEYLQKETHLNNSLLKNNSTNYLSYLNQELQKIENNEDIEGESSQDNERIFKQLTQTLSESTFQRDNKKEYFKSTNLNSKEKKEENELLHKISTFLQIALQNQHKEKWATKDMKKFRSTHGSFRFKKGKDERSKFFLKGIDIQKENKELFDMTHETSNSRSMSRKNTFKKSQDFLNKIKSEQRNIFGKRLPTNNVKPDVNDPSTITHWNVSNMQSTSPNNQNLNLFKIFNKEQTEERKTAPVKHYNNLFEDFGRTMAKDFQSIDGNEDGIMTDLHNELENSQGLQQLQAVIKVKRDYQLNKKRKHREYNFINPGRNQFHYKTVIVKPSNPLDQTVSYQVNNLTCTQGFSPNCGIIDLNTPSKRQKAIHTGFITQIPQKAQHSLTQTNDKLSQQKTQSLFKKPSSFSTTKTHSLAETFTFKNRNKKQQIMRKLETFIDQINNQEKISKMENEYYDSAINQLHDLSKTTYKNYQPEALAGHEEISELKRFVNGINPSLRKNHSKKTGYKKSVR